MWTALSVQRREGHRSWQKEKDYDATGSLSEKQAETLVAQGEEALREKAERERKATDARERAEAERKEREAQAREAKAREAEERRAREAKEKAEAERRATKPGKERRQHSSRSGSTGLSSRTNHARFINRIPRRVKQPLGPVPVSTVKAPATGGLYGEADMANMSTMVSVVVESNTATAPYRAAAIATRGQWRDGKRHGQGTKTWANGNRYEGQWRDNNRNGHGTMIFTDGDRYVGQWRNNMPHGRGVYTDHKGLNMKANGQTAATQDGDGGRVWINNTKEACGFK